MRFEVVVAIRYLRSSGLQTGLILVGVSVGIIAFVFIAGLINGLQERLIGDILGNLPHITLEPKERIPRLIEPVPDADVLLARQETSAQREEIEGWRSLAGRISEVPGVTRVSPQAVGGGFILRGGERQPVTLNGVVPENVSAIIDVEGTLERGTVQLGSQDAIVGTDLAEELDLEIGQRIQIRSQQERDRSLTVRGIFDIGAEGLNESLVLLDLGTAQSLLELERGVTGIELKVADIYDARRIAARLEGLTGLEATSWQEENAQLEDALTAQSQTGAMIRILSLITIVVAVAGVLQVAALQRSVEIGIMRSMGVRRRAVMAIFVLQGAFIGLLGSVIGAFLGWVFMNVILRATMRPDGEAALPVDPAQGEYLLAILIATVASATAAILPARSAARLDPVEVLQQ